LKQPAQLRLVRLNELVHGGHAGNRHIELAFIDNRAQRLPKNVYGNH